MTSRGTEKEEGQMIQHAEDTEDQNFQLAHTGFHTAWQGTSRVSHPGSSLVSISVAHAIRDSILAFLATVQYDLGS